MYLVHIDAFDAAFSTLMAEPGGGEGGVEGLSFYPEIPMQHTSSFCKTFSVLIIYMKNYSILIG